MYAGVSWCLVHLMTKDPKHMEKVRQEIQRVSDKYGGGGASDSVARWNRGGLRFGARLGSPI